MVEFCIFCKIRDGEVPGDVVYRDDTCFVIRDIMPQAPVHLLFIPLWHITYLAEMSDHELDLAAGLFRAARTVVRRDGLAEEGYRLLVNQGEVAGQMVPHLHLHLLAGRPLGPGG